MYRPHLVYDQKQDGEINVQVRVKDFQVIALLGQDSLAGLGDYDYNYDYSDFTVKPPVSITSTKPPADISTSSKPTEVTPTTTKADEKPSSTLEPEKGDAVISSTGKPLGLLGENKTEEEKLPSGISTTLKEEVISTTEKASSTTKKSEESMKPAADAIPGQIQVQILESPDGYPNFAVRKDASIENHDHEISEKGIDRKCETGYIKDKKGRCRRIRRPQSGIPFDFARLANLASRFRSVDKDGIKHSNNSKARPPIVHHVN
ncbi:hypothetical protein HHI36_009383 [Cryptolaemus montrouzieri]|uniref:Uncharacterized protein n=1 Tax=Cryptolaemus montrouzieri TaxID=559131 RepID=A0ABD2MVY3_9CUCU